MFYESLEDRCVFRGKNAIKYLLVAVLFINMTCLGVSGVNKTGFTGKSSQTLRSMARVYMAYGDYAKASPLAEQALDQALIANNEGEIGSCYGDLAYLYKSTGELDKAEKMCLASITIQKKTYFETHPYVAMSLRTLSVIYRDQNKIEAAKKALDDALGIMLDTHGKDEQAMAPFYVEYAKLYTVEGDNIKAKQYFEKASGMINQSYGPEHLYTAGVMKSYADYYSQCGQFDKATKLASKAIAIQKKVYGSNHHLLADTWLTLGTINHKQGHVKKAWKFFDKALSVISKTGNKIATAKLTEKINMVKIMGTYKTVALR